MATDTIPQASVESPAPPPPNGQTALAPTRPVKEKIQVHYNPDDPVSLYMDTGYFEQMQRVALLMARSNLVPVHLRGEEKVSDCFLITAQAFRWRMDPFSVAQHTFALDGKLGYEGKLIAGIINASGKLQGSLSYRYFDGPGPSRRVEVSGTLRGETEVRTVSGTVDQWSTRNEMWRKDPDQILAYRGAREWARRHMPEAVLGIHAEEELPAMVAGAVQMERQPSGTFADKRSNPPKDALLEAVGIGVQPSAPLPSSPGDGPIIPEIVLVDPAKPPLVDPAVCTHPVIPPSRLKPGKVMRCPDCNTDLCAPVEG